jgi:phospholipase/carboxylesterase
MGMTLPPVCCPLVRAFLTRVLLTQVKSILGKYMLSGPRFISHVPGSLSRLVVFLHGYGASGDDLISLSHEWENLLPPTIFESPNGPETCDVNPVGYQWFGLPDFSPTTIRLGLDRVRPVVVSYLKNLLAEHQLSPHDLALVGFSQGTILALDIMFDMPTLGAVLGYSGAFYPPLTFPKEPINTKVMLVHGTGDTVVPYAAMTYAKIQLQEQGIHVKTHTCDGLGHGIDTQGLQAGGTFLAKCLSPQSPPVPIN